MVDETARWKHPPEELSSFLKHVNAEHGLHYVNVLQCDSDTALVVNYAISQ